MEEYEIGVNELRDKLSDGGEEKFEYFNKTTNKWEELKGSPYMERNTGFPIPQKAAEEISLMQIFDSELKTMIILGVREWKHQADYEFDYPVKYIQCKDEVHLLESYLKIFRTMDPLIIYAWNGAGFDFPYIYNRIKNLGMDTDQLSNYGKAKLEQSEFQGRTEFKFKADGHHYIDTMVVYKKFILDPRTSYSLDNIALVELGKQKVDHSEYSTFDGFYTGDYEIPKNPTDAQKSSKIYKAAIAGDWDEVKELAHSEFVYYGAIDTYLIKSLDDKLNFTALMFMIAEKMGVLLSDALGTVKPWSQYILNKSHKDMKIMPERAEHDHPHIVGGYVRDPNAGKHNWVLSVDVNSMYPLLGMVGFNMSPETFVAKHELPPELRDQVLKHYNDQDEWNRFDLPQEEWAKTTALLKHHKLGLGINGAVFKTDEIGMVPAMVQEIYDSRKKAKKTMFLYERRKILISEILKEK